ncbi:unnamed protein product [Linum tenue]|uniref:Uncharacterized protein n=1 Tax=Linum tenue TaxID=586396 RepID=A0AAV0LG76_9ROSI|nr:unnamed protein product [Linum tenue]
MAKEDTLLQLS